MREHHRMLLAEANRLGGQSMRLVHHGRHPALMGSRPDGAPIHLVISGTPSCRRSLLNERARLRRKFLQET